MELNIISQIYLHVLYITVFYTKHLTPYTICVCLNPPHTILVSPVIFRNLTKTLAYLVLYTEGAKFTVQLIISVAALC